MDTSHQLVSGLRPISHPHNTTIATKVILLFYGEKEKHTHTHNVSYKGFQSHRDNTSLRPTACASHSSMKWRLRREVTGWDNYLVTHLQAVCPSQETEGVPSKPGVGAVCLPPGGREAGWGQDSLRVKLQAALWLAGCLAGWLSGFSVPDPRWALGFWWLQQ